MPDSAITASQAAYQLASTVDRAISAAVPSVVDLQVATTAQGVVVISGRVFTAADKQHAESVARSVPGVHWLVNSLTVI